MIADIPKPDAIVCISAHWETRGTAITTAQRPATLHDFSGFPQELFDIQYPCPGEPELAQRIIDRVSCTDTQPAPDQPFDHGVWSVLTTIYPEADIPVVQISLDAHQGPDFHFQLGRELAFLREENTLLIGSGNIVHNIQKWMGDSQGSTAWMTDFDSWLYALIEQRDFDTLLSYEELAPYASDAVPTPEHFNPLLYCLGASQESDKLYTSPFVTDMPVAAAMRSIRWG